MNNKKVQNLLLKGNSSIGMLAEALSKAKLLSNRLKIAKLNGTDTDEFIAQVQISMTQIKKDMAKYSNNIQKICEELKSHGISVKDME